jgi:hypothetical protein
LFYKDRYFDLKQTLKQLYVANITLELRHRHNNLKNSKSLIEFLEDYPKLPMYFVKKSFSIVENRIEKTLIKLTCKLIKT